MAKTYYPQFPQEPESEGLSSGTKKGLIAGGVGVGVPGLLYARGLGAKGIPLRQMPGAAWGQIKGRKSYDIASTLRAGTIGAGKDIGSIGPRIWGHLKGIGKGFAGKALSSDDRLVQLSTRLDQLIQFEVAFPKTRTALGIGAIGIGAGAAGLGAYKVVEKMRKQREWHKKAGPRDVLSIAPDLYVDRHGAMYPKNHPSLRSKRKTELSSQLDQLIQFQNTSYQIPAGQLPTFVVRRTTYIKKDDDKDRKVPASALLGAGGIAGAGIATGSAATRQLFKVAGKKLRRLPRIIRKWK